MHRLITLAESEGAVNVKIISARDVVVDERTRLKCQVPLCPHYNRALLCPPHVPPVSWFKSVLDRYERVLLLQVRAPVREGASDPEEVLQGAVKLHRIVNKVERAAYNWGFRFAAGLIGGNCRLCPECVGVHSNLPCRHPYEARPSMEAMGIDVGETLAKVGLTLKFPPEKEVFWTGMVLLD
ncbi:MAG: DUF2284 domain-containing protein [Moorellaceae bacterium]